MRFPACDSGRQADQATGCRRRRPKQDWAGLALAAALLLGTNSQLPAQTPGSDYEPPAEQAFQTETVETQDKGQITFTTGMAFNPGSDEPQSEYPAGVEYGITDHFQVKFELSPALFRNPGTRAMTGEPGDWRVGVKRDFLNLRDSDVHLAVGFNFNRPAAPTSTFSSGVNGYAPYFVVAKDLPRDSRVFSSFGFEFLQTLNPEQDPAAHLLNWSTGYYIPVSEYLVTAEYSWSTNRWHGNGQTNEMFLSAGLFRRLSDRWWLGVGAPIGLTEGTGRFQLMGSLIYEFNLLEALK